MGISHRDKLEYQVKGMFDDGGFGRAGIDAEMAGFDFTNRFISAPRPQEPKMPEEAESEKPFILYLDSLNTSVNAINMQCLR